MGKLTELVTGTNGLLPYLEEKLTGDWQQWKVRRYTGNIVSPVGPIRINQGATLGAFNGNVFSAASEFGIGASTMSDRTIIVAFAFSVPDLTLAAELAVGEFTDQLCLEWLAWAGRYMKADTMDGESISGGKPQYQQASADKQWYLVATATGRIKYLNDGN